MTIASGSNTLSNELYDALTSGIVFDEPTLPDLSSESYNFPPETNNPLYANVSSVSLSDVTTGAIDGTGAADKLITLMKLHLKEEWTAGRITGDQYTKAYTGLLTQAITSGLQFVLGQDQAYWQAILTQNQAKRAEVEAITARLQLEMAKAQLSFALAQNKTQTTLAMAQIAQTKMGLTISDADFQIKKQDLALRTSQVDASVYTVDNILPGQKELLDEQIEVQRAQTLDTRRDGTNVVGAVGKQKDLYSQQIESYKRDSEQKVAKLLVDSWNLQKSLDEGLQAPNEMTNATINAVLTKVRTNTGLT